MKATMILGLLGQAAARSDVALRVAGSRPVEGHEAVALQSVEQRMTKMMQLPAETVNEKDGWPLARLDIVDATAVDGHEFAGRRHHPLGVGGNASRREHEIADNGSDADHRQRKNPRHNLQRLSPNCSDWLSA